MIYMLEFLGLLAVAISLAASPVLTNVIERFFPSLDEKAHAAGFGLSSTRTEDRSEVRDEIRRMTNILENSQPNIGKPGPTRTARK